MKMTWRWCLPTLCALATAADAKSETQSTVTPVAKVLELLNSMLVKGEKDQKEEQVKFAAFSQWCSGQTITKSGEIENAGEDIMVLKATIQKAEAHVRKMSDRVYELEEDVGRWEKDTKSASDVRGKEKADYDATARDYGESLDALDGAIVVLKKQAYDRSQAEAALLQVSRSALVPVQTKQALSAFLQNAQPDGLSYDNSDSEAKGYEFQSGGVVDMLEKLKDEFAQKKYELDQEETTSQHAFLMIAQQLADNIEHAKNEIAKKATAKADSQQVKAEAEGNLAQTTSDRAEDTKYLGEMKAMCSTKSSDFESRQKLRAEEMEAIQKAVEIIGGDAVQGAGEKNLPQLLQVRRPKGAALAQLRSANSAAQSPLQARIAAFLADRAASCNSKLLSLMSQRVATDPFDKVKKMIKDLISKLMEESTAETEHKGWCDAELGQNKITREAKSEEVEKLRAEVEDLQSTIAQLGQEITDLAAAVAELDAATAKASEDRTATKAKNEQTIAEAKEAQMAIERAVAVLKDYYAKAAEATALTQQSPGDDAPETFGSEPYKGMLPEGGNVVDFLEVILSDFARLESDTSGAEASEIEMYKKYMNESEQDKALKLNEKGHKESTRTDKESALHSSESELRATQDQLDKAAEYYEKLKPTCVDSGITYEERVKRREEEIQSLQEALKILAGTDLA